MTQERDPMLAITPSPNAPGICSGCMYWAAEENPDQGRCHFNAPPLAPRDVGQFAIWPLTRPTDWCSQWVAIA